MEMIAGQIAELRALIAASDARLTTQGDLIGQASQSHADMQQRLALTEGQGGRLAQMLDELKVTSERALIEVNQKVERAHAEGRGARDHKNKLINSRDMKCSVFSGAGDEPYKPWAK